METLVGHVIQPEGGMVVPDVEQDLVGKVPHALAQRYPRPVSLGVDMVVVRKGRVNIRLLGDRVRFDELDLPGLPLLGLGPALEEREVAGHAGAL